MANILERYGIKEVADVTFYKITKEGEMGAPVLYLDTLKVSTIEQTAEQAEARGGKGNPPLVIWDYGKEITVTLEDALFSARSMAVMFGDGEIAAHNTVYKTVHFSITKEGDTAPTEWKGPNGNVYSISGGTYYTVGDSLPGADATGTTEAPTSVGDYYVTFPITVDGKVIDISANSFPGTYYVTGDTYARSEVTGEDEFFQFIIPKAKVQSENTITLEAEGDPSVFNMSLRVMRPADGGPMMKLVKYSVGE